MYGKSIRLSRLMVHPSERLCIVPMDHGTTYGPINGIENPIKLIGQIIQGGADAVVVHKGILKQVACNKTLANGRYIMHLSASTMLSLDSNNKVLIGSVEEALKLGADGVSIQVNLGTGSDNYMIEKLGEVSKACMEWGMPLLAMVYSYNKPQDYTEIAHAARLAEELGADLVKVCCPSQIEYVHKVMESVQIPVLIAGGSVVTDEAQLFKTINNVLKEGASGVAIGRNIFQRNNPEEILHLISKLVHGELKLEEVLTKLKY